MGRLSEGQEGIMRRRWVLPLVGGFLGMGVVILATYHPHRPGTAPADRLPSSSEPAQHPVKSSASPSPNQNKAEQKAKEDLTPVERFVQVESSRVGQVSKDPDADFKRLKAVAHNLKRQDFTSLKNAALNQNYNNDRRFLSIYLLALADDPSVSPVLMSVALSPLTETDPNSRLYAEELMIRTQALEGMAKFHGPGNWVLDDFLTKQDNVFLAEQARRLLQERRSHRKGS